MGIAINMDSFNISNDSLESAYGEEVMYSGWNPAITQLCQQQLLVPTNRLAVAPEDDYPAADFSVDDDDQLLQPDCWNDTGYAH